VLLVAIGVAAWESGRKDDSEKIRSSCQRNTCRNTYCPWSAEWYHTC